MVNSAATSANCESTRGKAQGDTYWANTEGMSPQDEGRLEGDLEQDVATIGAGYTVVSCATFLGRRYENQGGRVESQCGLMGGAAGEAETLLDPRLAGWDLVK
jgi:hypothetical protein